MGELTLNVREIHIRAQETGASNEWRLTLLKRLLSWVPRLLIPAPMRRLDVGEKAQFERIAQQLEAAGRLFVDLRIGSDSASTSDILSDAPEERSAE